MSQWTLKDGRKITLLTPKELKSLPCGTKIINVSGETRRVYEPNKLPPDDDDRGGFTAWGILPPTKDEQIDRLEADKTDFLTQIDQLTTQVLQLRSELDRHQELLKELVVDPKSSSPEFLPHFEKARKNPVYWMEIATLLREELEAERGKVYGVTEYAIEPFKKYIVYVINRGWTDGEYRTDSPKGWCHKWALDDALFGLDNRGVTHFMEQPTNPQELRRTE